MNLVGISEIGVMLSVSKQRAAQHAASQSFPKPLDRLAMGPVWRRSAVEKWIADRQIRR